MEESKKFHVGDDELLAIAAGDSAALGLLYDRLSPWVFGLIVRGIAEGTLAEKTLLTVFSLIWQTAPLFDPAKVSARQFVFDIAYRCASANRTAQVSASRAADVQPSSVRSAVAAVRSPE